MADVDDDGFLIREPSTVPRSPQRVAVPDYFADVYSRDEAIAKMISTLTEPCSVNVHGQDEMYRRLANALILILSIQGDLSP